MRSDTSRAAMRVTGGVGAALVAATVATAGPAHAGDHVVKPGDTVSHLALRYGTSTSAIVRANDLDSRALIRVGQRLAIPSASGRTTSTSAPSAPATRYTVKAGDTVSAIAARHGTTVAAVVKANDLDSRAFIRAGQRLSIPGKGSDGSSSSSSSSSSPPRPRPRRPPPGTR